MTWLRALAALLTRLPGITVVLHADHVGPVQHIDVAEPDDDDGCGCGDPDGAPHGEAWIVTPEVVRAWLEDVRDGADVDELMLAIDVAEIGGDG